MESPSNCPHCEAPLKPRTLFCRSCWKPVRKTNAYLPESSSPSLENRASLVPKKEKKKRGLFSRPGRSKLPELPPRYIDREEEIESENSSLGSGIQEPLLQKEIVIFSSPPEIGVPDKEEKELLYPVKNWMVVLLIWVGFSLFFFLIKERRLPDATDLLIGVCVTFLLALRIWLEQKFPALFHPIWYLGIRQKGWKFKRDSKTWED